MSQKTRIFLSNLQYEREGTSKVKGVKVDSSVVTTSMCKKCYDTYATYALHTWAGRDHNIPTLFLHRIKTREKITYIQQKI